MRGSRRRDALRPLRCGLDCERRRRRNDSSARGVALRGADARRETHARREPRLVHRRRVVLHVVVDHALPAQARGRADARGVAERDQHRRRRRSRQRHPQRGGIALDLDQRALREHDHLGTMRSRVRGGLVGTERRANAGGEVAAEQRRDGPPALLAVGDDEDAGWIGERHRRRIVRRAATPRPFLAAAAVINARAKPMRGRLPCGAAGARVAATPLLHFCDGPVPHARRQVARPGSLALASPPAVGAPLIAPAHRRTARPCCSGSLPERPQTCRAAAPRQTRRPRPPATMR